MKKVGNLIAENLKHIEDQIKLACEKARRPRESVKLIAVSKTVSIEKIQAALDAGHFEFGENYVQEFVEKRENFVSSPVNWHFIGHLQTNKVKSVVNQVALIHSVDRESLIAELGLRATSTQKILLEVNFSAEASKSGAAPEEVPQLLELLQKQTHIILDGLMVMPPLSHSPDANRRYFEAAHRHSEKWVQYISGAHGFREFSMGTSQDFELAIDCGATLIRLGTTIFGKRD